MTGRDLWDMPDPAAVTRPWVVPVTVVNVHDGDSMTVDADLGWHITMRTAVRVAHMNAPELATPEGKRARDAARIYAPVGAVLHLASHSLDKYGRSLGSLELPDGSDFATRMIAGGYAVPYEGGAR